MYILFRGFFRTILADKNTNSIDWLKKEEEALQAKQKKEAEEAKLKTKGKTVPDSTDPPSTKPEGAGQPEQNKKDD